MGRRRRARIIALQILYQVDLTREDPETALNMLLRERNIEEDAGGFARRLVRGVRAHLGEIDRLIQTASQHWRMDRMALVDRNILRLAVYEMLHCHDIPEPVTINEAVELGKHFGTEDSGAFINGILDHLRDRIPAPERQNGLGPMAVD